MSAAADIPLLSPDRTRPLSRWAECRWAGTVAILPDAQPRQRSCGCSLPESLTTVEWPGLETAVAGHYGEPCRRLAGSPREEFATVDPGESGE